MYGKLLVICCKHALIQLYNIDQTKELLTTSVSLNSTFQASKTTPFSSRPMLSQVLAQLSNPQGTSLNTLNTQSFLCLVLLASCMGNKLRMFPLYFRKRHKPSICCFLISDCLNVQAPSAYLVCRLKAKCHRLLVAVLTNKKCVEFLENALSCPDIRTCRSSLSSSLLDELSLYERDSNGFFSTRVVYGSSYTSSNSTDP